jgi:aldose 1-epimerase
MSLVRLSAGNLTLELSPSIGGAISAFHWSNGSQGAWPILRKCNTPLQKVLDASSFPLVPYVNRIRGGAFSFRGATIRIAPNMPADPSPLHGQGWLNPWKVESQDETSVVLSFRHEAAEWPWSYEALQEFSLDDRGFSLRLTCRNLSDRPMPCGLGQHPYFECGPATRIDTEVDCAWTIDDEVLPVEKVPAEGRYDLKDRLICGQQLDNGFGGWGGEARLTDPDWPFSLKLSSPQAKFFQLYSPPDGGIFVAEPVTHANAALNRDESDWSHLGMRVLEGGEAMSLDMRLEVTPRSRVSGQSLK